MITNVSVDRTDDGAYVVSWETGRSGLSVSIYVGHSPEAIDRTSPAARITGETKAVIPGLDQDRRLYFEVSPDGGPGIVAAERRVPFRGSVNFRDLGGYETAEGRRVKWGRVFRSDSLARLTDEDLAYLGRLEVRLVCDFRTRAEVDKGPDRLPEGGSTRYIHLPVEHGRFDPAVAMASMMKGDISWLTEDFMVKRYIRKIDDHGEKWGAVINLLAHRENRPLVFHCTGGKDRAGACAALILLVLGVPEPTVIRDHGLSNVYIAPILPRIFKQIRSLGLDPEVVAPYFTAPREAIVALVDHVRHTYGSAADYLKARGGVTDETIDLLKRELLE